MKPITVEDLRKAREILEKANRQAPMLRLSVRELKVLLPAHEELKAIPDEEFIYGGTIQEAIDNYYSQEW